LNGQTTTQAEQPVHRPVATTSTQRSLHWVLSVERGILVEYRVAALSGIHAKMEARTEGRCSVRQKLPVLFSLALSLALVASACAEDQPTIQAGGEGEAEAEAGHEDEGEGHEAQGSKEIGGEEATYHGTSDVSGESELQLELDDFYFGPTVLEGAAGQTLTLTLHNEGDAPHTFTIDGAVDEELEPGAEGVTADVTYPDTGALVFYCRFHRGQGMLGALSVGGSLEASGGGMEDQGVPGYDYG
jgi:plastocyanin